MPSASAIILAAGHGTRMKSDLPKVAHRVCGRAMVCWVVDACVEAGCDRAVLIVGHGQQAVRDLFEGFESGETRIEFAVQEPQQGTGHAVRCAAPLFPQERLRTGNSVFVLAGDGPLLRAATLAALQDRHEATGAAATLATAVLADSAGYGRVLRDPAGRFAGIVEHRNATLTQRAIREVNPSYYCFDAPALFDAVDRLPQDSVSGEYYLTDVLTLLLNEGRRVEVVEAVPPEDVLSINTLEDLAQVEKVLSSRRASSRGVAAQGGRAP